MSSLIHVAGVVRQEVAEVKQAVKHTREYGLLDDQASASAILRSDEPEGLPREAQKVLFAKLQDQPPPRLERIWASPNKVSLWALQPRGGQLSTGSCGNTSVSAPKVRCIRIVDESTSGQMGRSRWLDGAIAAQALHPAGFRPMMRVANDLFAWEPICPTDELVAIGQVFTTRPEPPSRDCVRCVPRAWTRAAFEAPRLLWAGPSADGSDVCSMWLINNLEHVCAVPGCAPPSGPFHELRDWPFSLGEAAATPLYEDSPEEAAVSLPPHEGVLPTCSGPASDDGGAPPSWAVGASAPAAADMHVRRPVDGDDFEDPDML